MFSIFGCETSAIAKRLCEPCRCPRCDQFPRITKLSLQFVAVCAAVVECALRVYLVLGPIPAFSFCLLMTPRSACHCARKELPATSPGNVPSPRPFCSFISADQSQKTRVCNAQAPCTTLCDHTMAAHVNTRVRLTQASYQTAAVVFCKRRQRFTGTAVAT